MIYSGTYVVWGPPGTGKTTYLERQVKKIADQGLSAMVCSLTQTAAAEIAGRSLPIPRSQVGTLHAHAFRELGHPEIAEGHIRDWNEDHAHYRLSESRTPNLDALSCDAYEPATPGDALYQTVSVLRARETPEHLWPQTAQNFHRAWCEWKQGNGLTDFADLIEEATRSVPSPPGDAQVIVADECQDLSRAELRLLRHWADAADALILCGDPYQALYCWRGAHPEMFMDPKIPDDHRKLLKQSYRVPEHVRNCAMAWVRQISDYRQIDYRPRPAPGRVDSMPVPWRAPHALVDRIQEQLDAGKSVMVMASCGYMLRPLISVLRQQGIPFSNPWRTQRRDWNPLGAARGISASERVLAFLRPDPDTWGPWQPNGTGCRTWTTDELHAWGAPLAAQGTLARGAKNALVRLAADRPGQMAAPSDIEALIEARAWEDLFERIPWNQETGHTERMLDWYEPRLLASKRKAMTYPIHVARRRGGNALRQQPRLYIGTIHSFKGAEADVVYLWPDLSPSAMREWTAGHRRRDTVVRMFYVAATRARETLIVGPPSTAYHVDFGRFVRDT